MAQQEMMLRLLNKGIIVGEMQIENGEVYYHEYVDEWEWLTANDIYILWDSFELGVKVGETWYFSGDILEITDTMFPFDETETFMIDDNLFIKLGKDKIHITELEKNKWKFKKLGTIHDGGEYNE